MQLRRACGGRGSSNANDASVDGCEDGPVFAGSQQSQTNNAATSNSISVMIAGQEGHHHKHNDQHRDAGNKRVRPLGLQGSPPQTRPTISGPTTTRPTATRPARAPTATTRPQQVRDGSGGKRSVQGAPSEGACVTVKSENFRNLEVKCDDNNNKSSATTTSQARQRKEEVKRDDNNNNKSSATTTSQARQRKEEVKCDNDKKKSSATTTRRSQARQQQEEGKRRDNKKASAATTPRPSQAPQQRQGQVKITKTKTKTKTKSRSRSPRTRASFSSYRLRVGKSNSNSNSNSNSISNGNGNSYGYGNLNTNSNGYRGSDDFRYDQMASFVAPVLLHLLAMLMRKDALESLEHQQAQFSLATASPGLQGQRAVNPHQYWADMQYLATTRGMLAPHLTSRAPGPHYLEGHAPQIIEGI
jgi:hypothetical protein